MSKMRIPPGQNSSSKDYFGGYNSPESQRSASSDFKGSGPSQSGHWNFRPPIFLRSKYCIGLWHFGQIGAGAFFGMMLSLDQAGAQHSQSPMNAEAGAVMGNSTTTFVSNALHNQILTPPIREEKSIWFMRISPNLPMSTGCAFRSRRARWRGPPRRACYNFSKQRIGFASSNVFPSFFFR
jgi:hypothetical protein